jgi:serpin B
MAKRSRKVKPYMNEEAVTVTQSFNSFAIDLYKQLAGNGDNIFFSPFSISIALAMTYAGAKGDTAAEMSCMLHIQGNEELLARGAAAIIAEMHANETQVQNQLNLANALWIHIDFPIDNPFSEQIREYFLGEIVAVDFKHVEAARAKINAWVYS